MLKQHQTPNRPLCHTKWILFQCWPQSIYSYSLCKVISPISYPLYSNSVQPYLLLRMSNGTVSKDFKSRHPGLKPCIRNKKSPEKCIHPLFSSSKLSCNKKGKSQKFSIYMNLQSLEAMLQNSSFLGIWFVRELYANEGLNIITDLP